MRQLATLVGVLVVLSACTADTTEGDEDTTATTAATSEDTAAASEDEKVLRVGVTDDTSDWESGTPAQPGGLDAWHRVVVP